MSKRRGRCYGCRKKILQGEEIVCPEGYKHHARTSCILLGRKRLFRSRMRLNNGIN